MKQFCISLICVTSLYAFTTYACTDFQLKAKDGTILITRSMEFGIDLASNLRTSTREREESSRGPNDSKGLTWKDKYGYVYLDGFKQDIVLDGMNEAGLTFEYLYLPGETQYPIVPAGKNNQALSYVNFGAWILGNFKSIDEVKKALSTVYIFQGPIPGMGNTMLPAHAAIHDANGKGLVVEFVKGKMMIHDYMGVMTNSPTYDWQITNLRNYLNLSPYNPQPVVTNNLIFSATGQGSGMVGLPGDASPPSRFVKIAFLLKNAYQADTAADALNLAEHIINNVDIPNGFARTKANGTVSSDTTEWVVFKDMTNKKLYYRTYNDMTLRSISFDHLDFSPNAPLLKMPLMGTPYVMDMNNIFLSAKR